MLPVVILAGGRGTRVASLTGHSLPKPMLPVAGRPFIDYKLAHLASEGVSDVILLVGHAGERLVDHVGDGSRFGLRVSWAFDPPALLGTGGALRAALGLLPPAFWVTYGDSFLPVALTPIESAFLAKGLPGLMTVIRNRDRWAPSNVAIRDGLVVDYRKGAPPGTFEHIDYGLLILERAAVAEFPAGVAGDLEQVFTRLVDSSHLVAHEVSARFYDIGSPESVVETERFFQTSDTWRRLSKDLVRLQAPRPTS